LVRVLDAECILEMDELKRDIDAQEKALINAD
jgi:hypothetical protein